MNDLHVRIVGIYMQLKALIRRYSDNPELIQDQARTDSEETMQEQ